MVLAYAVCQVTGAQISVSWLPRCQRFFSSLGGRGEQNWAAKPRRRVAKRERVALLALTLLAAGKREDLWYPGYKTPTTSQFFWYYYSFTHPQLILLLLKVHMTRKISHFKNTLILKAFQSRVNWRFFFCDIFLPSRDIQVFLLCKFSHWWRHRLCKWSPFLLKIKYYHL